LLKRLRHPIQRAIMDADLRAENIDRIVLVGGATRMPAVKALITRMFQKFPEHSLDPDEVIALGAAVQAGLVDKHAALNDIVMTDVCPFTLGTDVAVETGPEQFESGHFQPLIERNTVIPVSRSTINSTMQPGQTSVTISVYQGESAKVKNNVFLGQITAPVPKNKTERETLEIRFTYDVSGVLEVIVKIESTQVERRLIIEGNPGVLSQAEIDSRFKALEGLKVHPRDEAININFMSRLDKAYESYLGDDRRLIQNLIVTFEAALGRQDKHVIAAAREEIEPILAAFEDSNVF